MYRLRIIRLISLWIAVQWQVAVGADPAVAEVQQEESSLELFNQIEQQKALFNQQIIALESEYGIYDQRLLEPLAGLTPLLVKAADFEEVGRVLDRRLQLLRIVEGPSTLNQLQVISEVITNDIRRRDWQSVSESFDTIRSIHIQNPDVETAILLNILNDVRNWHLSVLYIDELEMRELHINNFKKDLAEIIALADKEYGRESEQLIPWLYGIAIDQDRMNRTSFGIRTLQRIQNIVEAMGDPEAQAMAMLYVADFELLYQRNMNVQRVGGPVASRRRGGESSYRKAMEMFRDAGIEEERIETFFARPVVLPVPEFHLSLEMALAKQSANGYSLNSNAENGEGTGSTVHLGDFIAWDELTPFTRRPPLPELASALDTEFNTAQVRFTIDSIGKSKKRRAEYAEPDIEEVQRVAKNAIEHLQFRPAFVNRRWRQTRNVTLRYLYPSPILQ